MFDFNEQFKPGSKMYCNDSITKLKEPSLCGLEMNAWEMGKGHAINITVPTSRDHNEDYTAILKLRSSGISYDKLWDDYQLDPIEIQVVNDGPLYDYPVCLSLTDPWFLTFDKRWYGFQDEGEFLLFKHKTKPIEVHTIQQKHIPTASWTENCAVALRAASDVFIIYGCGHPTKWIVGRLNCKEGSDYLKIYKRWDEYEIHLPSGTIVRVMKEMNRRLNIQIYLSHSDQSDVEGMCGNANNNYWDDYTSMNNPTLFARSWSVPDNDSLFVATAREEKLSLSYMYCTCLSKAQSEAGTTLSPNVDCSWQENIPVCPPINWTYDACKIKHRSTRSADDDDDIVDVPSDIIGHKEHPESDANWKNGWNESRAEMICLSTFKESPVYEACISLDNMNISSDLETCITNIPISGTTDFVIDSLNSFTSQCSMTLRVNTSLHDAVDENGNNVFDEIFNNMCPNDCKYGGLRTGNCVNGFCICFNGYTGDDCRINKTSPPTISGLSAEYVCDSSIKGCNTISIYGDGFYPSDNLRCRLRHGKLTETSIIAEGFYIETSASYRNSGEVKCDVSGTRRKRSSVSPLTATVYHISISTNGYDFSDDVPVVIYDSNCMDCNIVNSLMICSTKIDVCIIGDTCQPIDDLRCQTKEKENEGKEEPKSKSWIIGVIIGVLAVVIIMLFVIKWKKHNGVTVIPFCHPRGQSNYEDYRFSDDVNNYDTLSEGPFQSVVSLQNIPPLST